MPQLLQAATQMRHQSGRVTDEAVLLMTVTAAAAAADDARPPWNRRRGSRYAAACVRGEDIAGLAEFGGGGGNVSTIFCTVRRS